MRVVFTGPLVGHRPTGPAVHMVNLFRAIRAARGDIDLVSRHATRHGSSEHRRSAACIDASITARTIPAPERLVRATQLTFRMPRERWLVGGFDLYHQLHTDANPAVPARRLIVTLHDTVALEWPEEEGRISPHASTVLKRAAAVITVSEFSKQKIRATFDVHPSKIHVVHNGIDQTSFAPSSEWPGRNADRGSPPFVLVVGGATPRKNIDRLVEAVAIARREPGLSDLRLVLAGPSITAEVQIRAKRPRDLPDAALEFLGYVEEHELVDLYRRADVVACVSVYEGFGMTALEAMACGAPVLVSDGNALGEIAGPAALRVNPFDSVDIASGLRRLLTEGDADRAGRRRGGLNHVKQFTWDGAARSVIGIYDDVLALPMWRR